MTLGTALLLSDPSLYTTAASPLQFEQIWVSPGYDKSNATLTFSPSPVFVVRKSAKAVQSTSPVNTHSLKVKPAGLCLQLRETHHQNHLVLLMVTQPPRFPGFKCARRFRNISSYVA